MSGVNPLLVKLRKLSFCSSPPPLPSSPIWAAVDIWGEFIVLRGLCDCCCDPWEGNHKVEMHCDKNLLLLFTQSGTLGEVGWFLSCCIIPAWGIMNVETDITWTTIHVTLKVLLRVALHQICSNTHIMTNDHSDQTCSKVQASSCLRRSPRHLWPAPPAFIYILSFAFHWSLIS